VGVQITKLILDSASQRVCVLLLSFNSGEKAYWAIDRKNQEGPFGVFPHRRVGAPEPLARLNRFPLNTGARATPSGVKRV
jgi:hypothetical protein